ncbi:PDR/VanB family oxidoreductase [Hyphomicrobium sp.]|uniref:PDR/VanB family oxidoreductase n=1 Tax=Hyphomicrobium sp. TaxID=82 RepID=UPI003F6F9083
MSGAEIPVRVARVEVVAERIKRIRFVPVDGRPLPTYSAGAHTVVTMRDGAKTIKNPYSLMGPLNDTTGYEISVLKTSNSHGGSLFVHEKLYEGAFVSISPPSNLFALDLRARKHLLIAGGIGITPISAMAEQLSQIGAPFELHYSTRTPSSGAYVDELKQRYGRKLHHYQTVSNRRINLENLLGHQPLGTHLYVCGPDAMIEDVLRLSREAGWPDEHLHAEHFTAPRSGMPFNVELAKSAKTVRVNEDESILQALESAGLEPPYLCRGGACGQCETGVVNCDGNILHYDHYLTDEEKQAGRKIMICVSRIKGSNITLDL